MRVAHGGPLAVIAAAAPLWVSVEAADRVGPFAGTSYPAFRDWVRRVVDGEGSLNGALDSVALAGEPVEVLEEAGAGWLRVRLPAQPDEGGGYAGFMRAESVGTDARGRVTHLLTADLDSAAAGTTVEVADTAGSDAEVILASGERLRAPRPTLRPVGRVLGPAAVLATAHGYLGTPYVWGGVDRTGIDCSGLVHTAARICGQEIPRDAHHQWATTRIEVAWDALLPGDLLFFGERASLDGIDHVGLYAGEGRMLHAPEEGRSVVLESISQRARERYVGVGRLQDS